MSKPYQGLEGLEVEYLLNTKKPDDGIQKLDTTSSAIFEAKYKLDQWTPILKLESSSNVDDEDSSLTTSKKRTAASLAFEYQAKENSPMKYYFGYNNKKDTDGTGNLETQNHNLYAGFYFTGDLWKN